VTTNDLDEYVAVAGDVLRAQPVENTILLTIVENLRKRGRRVFGDADPQFGWWLSGSGEVGGALLRTPPFPFLVTGMAPEAVGPIVPVLVGLAGTADVAINAERRTAQALAAQWLAQTGVALQVQQELRLHRLATLTPPQPTPPGLARAAEPPDRDVLIDWWEAFGREVREVTGDAAAEVDNRIGYGGLLIWDLDGAPVSMAGRTRPAAAIVRIGPVFTPISLRQRGYAAAVTAAISREAQGLADEVVLFTDLANPTSNAIYRRLGYQPVQDRVKLGRG
jgi:phage gp46-like protein